MAVLRWRVWKVRPCTMLHNKFENSEYSVVVFKLISVWNHRHPWRF
ncbi:hypothetical protein HMPREF9554_02548 [Treponema phagedenis F0421]|nr:hypothetical protein HMPREF9554_02548 [Treponema phagedenis F0421]